MIQKAQLHDVQELDQLAVAVISNMKESNIPQWTMKYPRLEHFTEDIKKGGLYIYKDQETLMACMALFEENDPPYQTISSWQKDKSLVIHRVLVKPDLQHSGIGRKLFAFAEAYGMKHGYESIKIDTHLDNYKMRSFLESLGYIKGDYIQSIDRIAYEKILEETR